MSTRLRRRAGFDQRDVLCHWCHQPAAGTPYRSPIEGIPGGRWTVCGPDCPHRPDRVQVTTTKELRP